jgi:N-acetylmuramoyl-L-alanine amidase-like protein
MSLKRLWMPSPNYSSRGGAGVRLIVLHTAEGPVGPDAAVELGNYFKSSSSGVSSHVGADDTVGRVVEYVKRGSKAWTAANANPVAVQLEACAKAGWSRAQWLDHPNMLENIARWIAEESKATGIPITKLSPSAAQGSGRGVCQHDDLGSWGGGHWDCGGGFPIDDVLEEARAWASGEGGKDDYMDPPAWLWPWLDWYENTDRDKADRPEAAPDDIPQWAWDYQVEVAKIAKRKGTTTPERDWMDWRAAGADPDARPDGVPEKIPERWWTDNDYVLARVGAAEADPGNFR